MKNPWLKRNQIKEVEKGFLIRIFMTEERYYNIEYALDPSMADGKKTLTIDLMEDSSEIIGEMFTKIVLPKVLGFGEHFNNQFNYGSNFSYNPSLNQPICFNDFNKDFTYNITFGTCGPMNCDNMNMASGKYFTTHFNLN